MSGSVNSLSYRLGSSMTWGYSTSPIFLSFKVKNTILLSKLLPNMLIRFGLHVVEFYSFSDNSFLLVILISKLFFFRPRIRRRYTRRRSRKKKAFHRITYSLNKNFTNWRVLSFVRNSFRRYTKILRVLAFVFYSKGILVSKYKSKKLRSRVRITKKIFSYFEHKLFLLGKLKKKRLNSKFTFNTLIKLLSSNKSIFRRNLRQLGFLLSPISQSRRLLVKNQSLRNHYLKKFRLKISRLSQKLKRGNLPMLNSFRDRHSRRKYPRTAFGKRKKFFKKRFSAYSSFKGLLRYANTSRFLFNIFFTKTLLYKPYLYPSLFVNRKRKYSYKLFRLKRGIVSYKNRYAVAFSLRPSSFKDKWKSLNCKLYKCLIAEQKPIKPLFNRSLLTFTFNRKLVSAFLKRLNASTKAYRFNSLANTYNELLLVKEKKLLFFKRRILYRLFLRQRKLLAYKKPVRLISGLSARNLHNYRIIKLNKTFSGKYKRFLPILRRSYFLRQRLSSYSEEGNFLDIFFNNKRLKKKIQYIVKKFYYRHRLNFIFNRHVGFKSKKLLCLLKKKLLFELYCSRLISFGYFIKNKLSFLTRSKRFLFCPNVIKKYQHKPHYYTKKKKRFKKLVIKNLYFFNKRRSSILQYRKYVFNHPGLLSKYFIFLTKYKTKVYKKKKWVFKKNFEFFISEFMRTISGLFVNVFFLDGLTLFSRHANSERILATKLVFKRAFISKKNYFFFKNFVNLMFQSIFFKTIWSLTRYFSRVYYYRKTQKHTTQTVNRVFKTISIRTIRFVGINILISGKIGRRRRAKSICFTKNKLPNLSSLSLKVQYCYTQCVTNFGVYGIKLWLYTY